jgi:2-oxoglutarate ferredoxin oxidoreductase subunit alpha
VLKKQGKPVSHANLRYLNPFPANFEAILRSYERVVVPEVNGGQLAFLLRGKFALDIESFPKAQARPFRINEILEKIEEILA